MGFVAIKKPDGGRTVLWDGLLYVATSLARPTIFKTKSEINGLVKASQKKWPDVVFQIVEEKEEVEVEEEGFLKPVEKDEVLVFDDDEVQFPD